MTSKPFVLRPADRKPALNVLGTQMTVLASGSDIEDQQIVVQVGDEGMGPPPHSHDWDESFYITRGQVVFTCEGETTLCPAGTLVHLPAGTVHTFRIGPGGAEMLEITGKRSNAISMFTALDRELPPGPPDVAKAIQVLSQNGVKVQI
jgi:quercetin dioxygenase-like cupin family protein